MRRPRRFTGRLALSAPIVNSLRCPSRLRPTPPDPHIQPTGRSSPSSAWALAAYGDKWNVGWCGRGPEGPQLMRKSLGAYREHQGSPTIRHGVHLRVGSTEGHQERPQVWDQLRRGSHGIWDPVGLIVADPRHSEPEHRSVLLGYSQ